MVWQCCWGGPGGPHCCRGCLVHCCRATTGKKYLQVPKIFGRLSTHLYTFAEARTGKPGEAPRHTAAAARPGNTASAHRGSAPGAPLQKYLVLDQKYLRVTCALLLGQGGAVLPGDGPALLPGHGLALLAGRVAARLAGDGGALLPRHHPGHLLTPAT